MLPGSRQPSLGFRPSLCVCRCQKEASLAGWPAEDQRSHRCRRHADDPWMKFSLVSPVCHEESSHRHAPGSGDQMRCVYIYIYMKYVSAACTSLDRRRVEQFLANTVWFPNISCKAQFRGIPTSSYTPADQRDAYVCMLEYTAPNTNVLQCKSSSGFPGHLLCTVVGNAGPGWRAGVDFCLAWNGSLQWGLFPPPVCFML